MYGIWYSYSVFLVALLREFGWSRSAVAAGFSVFAFMQGVAGLALGPLCDRFGPRRLVLTGVVVLAVALQLDAVIMRPWHLYLAFGVLTSIGVGTAGWVPGVVLVQRWFPNRVGVALGIVSSGIGMGIFLVVPFAQLLIDLVGWRAAWRILGGVILLWQLPATYWLVRDPPNPVTSPSRSVPAAGERAGSSMSGADITLAGALRRTSFWLLGVVLFLASTSTQMLFVHQAAFLVDHGIAAMVAATVVSVVGVASIAGKSGAGWLSDVVSREVAFTLGMASVVVSIGCLGVVALHPSPALAYVYALFIGLGYSVTAPIIPAVTSDLFRGRHYGAIFGAVHFATALGSSFGPWFAGRVFDATASYALAFGIGIVTAIVSATGMWIVAPRRSRAR